MDKKEAHVQEQVTLTFRFYQHVNLLESPNYTAPTTTGFWSEDLPPQRTFNEVINGRRYFVTEVKTALFGTAPGKFTIGPAQLDCVVPKATSFDQNDPFSLFGRPMMDGLRMSLKSEPLTVTIKSLPPGAPPEFTGAVGSFKVNARLDKSTVPQGEPLTLLLDVSGAGNIKSVTDPAWPAMTDFKVYDSTSSSDVSKDGGVVRGKKSWQQILVPLKAGDLAVPPVRFAYFDPKSDRYEILESPPLNVQVTPAATTAGGGVGGSATRGAIEVVGQDIRFIHTGATALRARGRAGLGRPVLLAAAAPAARPHRGVAGLRPPPAPARGGPGLRARRALGARGGTAAQEGAAAPGVDRRGLFYRDRGRAARLRRGSLQSRGGRADAGGCPRAARGARPAA